MLLVDWCLFSAQEDAMQFLFLFLFSFFWFQKFCEFFQNFKQLFFNLHYREKKIPIFFVFKVQKIAPKTNDGKKSSKRNQNPSRYIITL